MYSVLHRKHFFKSSCFSFCIPTATTVLSQVRVIAHLDLYSLTGLSEPCIFPQAIYLLSSYSTFSKTTLQVTIQLKGHDGSEQRGGVGPSLGRVSRAGLSQVVTFPLIKVRPEVSGAIVQVGGEDDKHLSGDSGRGEGGFLSGLLYTSLNKPKISYKLSPHKLMSIYSAPHENA